MDIHELMSVSLASMSVGQLVAAAKKVREEVEGSFGEHQQALISFERKLLLEANKRNFQVSDERRPPSDPESD